MDIKNKNYQEFALVTLVVGVIAMIIVPIPHQLMDVLIATNIALTVIVMMVVLYMQSPLEISSFPTILLVLALFRIGITISSSRLILLDGDAGEIISTFGNFVVGGNLIVGVIIFAIITLINFMVITKGSERVAEVTARFSLDAMPGKQMSIDSDLRAGNISMDEAQRRRNVLGMESKLFGAMDGAMKFVKGDAIAGMIDIFINIMGGIIIGTVQHSLPFMEALKTYTILTIGDGLVQQIPSLLISLTAGMMITRVGDDDNRDNLGISIIRQMFTKPKVINSSAIMFILFALIPGMPTLVFIILSGILFVIGYSLKGISGSLSHGQTSKTVPDIIELTNHNENFVSWKLHPLTIKFSKNLDIAYANYIKICFIETKAKILKDLGIEVPSLMIEYSEKLPNELYQLNIFEAPITDIFFYHKKILVFPSSRDELNVYIKETEYIENKFPLSMNETFWVDESYEKLCFEKNIKYMSNKEFIKESLNMLLNQHSYEYLGMSEIKQMLDKMNEYQELIKELYRMLPLNRLAEIFQKLIQENISIRNAKLIIDTLLEWAQREKEVIILVEHVRMALGRYIVNKYSQETKKIICFIVDQGIEDIIRDAIRFNDKGSYLSLDPEMEEAIIMRTKEVLSESSSRMEYLILICQLDIRIYLRSILITQIPNVVILSYQEVEKYATLNSLGVISIH